jgi:hypothetical protein
MGNLARALLWWPALTMIWMAGVPGSRNWVTAVCIGAGLVVLGAVDGFARRAQVGGGADEPTSQDARRAPRRWHRAA